MEKLYKKIGWKNRPNLATPLGATNLNKIDEALDGLDNRTLELNSKDAEQGRHIEGLYAEVRTIQEDVSDNTLQIRVTTSLVDSLLDNIRGLSEELSESQIVNTASGSTAYIDDASNMGIKDIDFYGESKQMQTTGKNLLPLPYAVSNSTIILEGVTFNINTDGSVKVNGTSTGDAYINFYYNTDKMLVKEPFIFSKKEIDNTSLYYIERIDGTWGAAQILPNGTKEMKITPSANATGQIFRLTVQNGKTANNITVKPMIRLASVTDDTWEKSTGGKASPNPDYPQPIEMVKGKNELQNTAQSKTDAGLTYTVNDDKSVTVNGTATGLSIVKVGSFKNTDRDLILSGCPSGGNTNTYKLSYYHETTQVNDFGNGVTLPQNDLTYEVRIVIYGGTTINNLTFYPMIRKASIKDSSYAPYNCIRLDVLRKNLLQNTGKDIERIGLTYTMQSDGSVKVVGTTTEADYQVLIGQVDLPKGSYILSGAPNNICRLRIAKGDNSTLLGHDLGSGFSFTLEEQSTVFVSVRTQSTVGTNINAVYYPMIRLASITDATYEPYQSQTVFIPNLELNGFGGVRDTDKMKKFAVVVFDGSEAWYKHDEQYPHLFKTSITPYANGNASVLCSHFLYDSGDLLGGNDGCRFRLASSTDVFYISSSKHTDVAEFKSWLASNPVTLVYELAEAEETALPQADIDAIKALHSYKPNTIVMNDADAEMDVRYVADAKTYIDKKFEALASAIEK